MAPQHESSMPLLSPTYRFANTSSRNMSLIIRVAMSGVILLTVSGFIFSMSSLYQGLQIVDQLKAASRNNLTSAVPGSAANNRPTGYEPSQAERPSVPNTFYSFFETLRHPITAPSYTDVKGNIFETRDDGPWWTEPLGNKVLIVDIDTRFPDGKNELWNNGRLDWERMGDGGNGILSASQMSHYLYAQVHGYDYRFFNAHELEGGLHSTWVKPHVIHELLGDYQFVVFIDGDALVTNLDVPLEWMFNRWGITEETSIAVPIDVQMGDHTDSKGNKEINTGFVVAQSLPVTFQLLKAWKDCTDEKRYPGCGRWKDEWSHEQRAFSEYIRYDPEFVVSPTSIVEISCDDAMGYPGLENVGYISTACRGNFIRHHTINKAETVRRAELAILQSVVDLAKKDLMRNEKTYRIDEKEREITAMKNNMTNIEIVHDTGVSEDTN